MTRFRYRSFVLTFGLAHIFIASCPHAEIPVDNTEHTSETAMPSEPVATVLVSLTEEVSDPDVAFENFFDWYQDAWLMQEDEVGAMDNMPRPLRQLAVMHQAFGLMSSNGPSGYYSRFGQVFDAEVVLGLRVLGHEESCSAITEGRDTFEAAGDEDLSIDQNSDIYVRLPPLEEIEEQIGQWMLKQRSEN